MHCGAFSAYPLRELAIGYRYHFHQEVLAESIHVLFLGGAIFCKGLFHPGPERGPVIRVFQLAYDIVIHFPHLGRGFTPIFIIEIAGDLVYKGFHYRESGSEYHSGFACQRFRQRPFLWQIAAGGCFLVVMDQRQARVLERQHASGHGHLESGIQSFGDVIGHAEFFFKVKLPLACGELYGLVGGIYFGDAVVAGRRFDDADDVLVYLLVAPVHGYRLYHIFAGEYFVEVMLAEKLVPCAGRAAGYAGDGYAVEVESIACRER